MSAGLHRHKLDHVPTAGLVAPPAQAVDTLDDALQRYLAMNCATCGIVPFGQVLRDRTNFIHLYDPAYLGQPRTDVRKQLEFMHAVTGLPKDWCAYWIYMDWLMVIAGKASDDEVEGLVMESYENALAITEGNA